jgi:integrase
VWLQLVGKVSSVNINKRLYPDGRLKWRARYPDPTRGGKKQIERQFGTRREAERWLMSQKAAIQRGEHIDPKDHHRMFEDVAAAWEATWLDLEPKTKAGYKSILNRHVLRRWQGVRIGAVTPEAIQEWLNELACERHANTVRRIYSVLRAVMKVAVERRYLLANPCDAVRLPRAPAVAIDQRVILSASEVAALAEAITPRYRLLIYAAAYTGLRAGELGALRRRDVDLLHGSLNVERALKDVSGRHIFGPTKTAKARRVGMPRFLVEMFTEHLVALDGGPDALVFRSPDGGPLRHHNMYVREFKPTVQRRYCAECDVTVSQEDKTCPECGGDNLVYVLPPEKHNLRFHDLRHTCASLLIAAGAHPKAIQEHLGHKDIQTTFNVYGHLLPSAQKALAAALDTVFDGERPDNVRSLSTAAGATSK